MFGNGFWGWVHFCSLLIISANEGYFVWRCLIWWGVCQIWGLGKPSPQRLSPTWKVCLSITDSLWLGSEMRVTMSGCGGVKSSGHACSWMISPSSNIIMPNSLPGFSGGLFSYNPRHWKWLRLSASMLYLLFMCKKVMKGEIEKFLKPNFVSIHFWFCFWLIFEGAWSYQMTTSV